MWAHDQVGCVVKIREEHLGINCIQKGTLPQKTPAGPKAVCKLQGNGTLLEKSYQAEWWEPDKLTLADPLFKLQLGEQDNEVYFLVGTGASYHPEMILQQ